MMIRRIFLAMMCAAFASPLFAQIPIMIYHAHPNFGYDETLFASHMDFLAANGYHTITLDQFYEWHQNAQPLPLRPRFGAHQQRGGKDRKLHQRLGQQLAAQGLAQDRLFARTESGAAQLFGQG